MFKVNVDQFGKVTVEASIKTNVALVKYILFKDEHGFFKLWARHYLLDANGEPSKQVSLENTQMYHITMTKNERALFDQMIEVYNHTIEEVEEEETEENDDLVTVFRVQGKDKVTGEIKHIGDYVKEEYALLVPENADADQYEYLYYRKVEGYECEQCGTLETNKNDVMVTDIGYVCIDCYDEYFYSCYSCDDIFHVDHLYWSDWHEAHICQHCYEQWYTTCQHCGMILPVDDAYYVDYVGHFCETHFYENYSVCDSCREVYPVEEIAWHDGEEAYLCNNCTPNVIRGYSYEPKLIFHKLPDEVKPLYLGIELEIDEGGYSDYNAGLILDVANKTEDEKHIVIKDDGSIPCGFEIASQPCSYEYHMSVFPWANILKTARELGYKSHDTKTCGLHVHVDRKYMGETREEQDRNIAKLCLLVELFSEQMKKIGRRNGNQYAHYVTDFNSLEYVKKDLVDEMKKSRYRVVNLQNDHTVELRFFRGTLNYNTFMATIQFIKFLVDYSISQSLERIEQGLTWEEFISVVPSKYTYLVDYLKKKQLWYEPQSEQRA